MQLHPGYGAEHLILPMLVARLIIENDILPEFKAGRFLCWDRCMVLAAILQVMNGKYKEAT